MDGLLFTGSKGLAAQALEEVLVRTVVGETVRMLFSVPLDEIAIQEMATKGGLFAGIPVSRLVAELRRLRDEIALDDNLLAERDALLDEFPCPDHGRCVPHTRDLFRRLGSDEWLKAAAEEIAALPTEGDPSAPGFTWEQPTAGNADTIQAILRKHRDGEA